MGEVSLFNQYVKRIKTRKVKNSEDMMVILEKVYEIIMGSIGCYELEGSKRKLDMGETTKILKSTFDAICNIDIRYIFDVHHSPDKLIKLKLEYLLADLLEELEPFTFSSSDIFNRLRTMDDLQKPMQENYCGMINHHLKLFSTCLRDNSDLLGWKAPEAQFVDTYNQNIQFYEYNNDPKVGLLMIVREEYLVNEKAGMNSFFQSDLEKIIVRPMDDLNWSPDCQNDSFVCSDSYTIKSCNTLENLLEIFKYFQCRVAELIDVESWNIEFIFLMCTAVLHKARSFENEITFGEICTIFDRVYSILDFILPSISKLGYNEESKVRIMMHCTNIFKHSSAFSPQFSNEPQLFKNYVDILFKYVVVLKTTSLLKPQSGDYFYIRQKSAANVYRKYVPNNIEKHMEFWYLKFADLTNLKDVLMEAEQKPMCTICGHKFNESENAKMAILERCNHVYCSECLMGNINKASAKRNKVFHDEEFFKCPQPDCMPKQAGFILGRDYVKIRSSHLSKVTPLLPKPRMRNQPNLYIDPSIQLKFSFQNV